MVQKNKIIYNKEVLKSNIYDYILVNADIITTAHNSPAPVAFKNCASFAKCITKAHETAIDNVEDLDLVMSMYKLLEYS